MALLAFGQVGCRLERQSSRPAELVGQTASLDGKAPGNATYAPARDDDRPIALPRDVATVSYDHVVSPEIVPPGPLAEEIVTNGQNHANGDNAPRLGDRANGLPGDEADANVLNLHQVVAIARRQNPQLGIARAEIGKAAAGKKMAFSAFLPRVGIVDSLNTLDCDVHATPSSAFDSFLPLNWNSQYNQVELETQWILWDFGRRLGTYRQADILVEIARLRYQRACQTVAFDATDAYYRVLLAYSTVITAKNTLRRAEEYLRVAKNLFEQGEIDRESIYSAELQVAKAKQGCVSARTRVNTSTAQLNLTMGRNTVIPTRVQRIDSRPQFQSNLLESLDMAVAHRREIRVVADWVVKAHEATAVAKADFMPKVVTGANYSSTGGDMESDSTCGYIAFSWDIYTGGKRVGRLDEERADVARAIANSRQVCDRIAFEVNYAYQKVEDAAERIDLARSAVRLARERLRIVMNKFEQGEVGPTDVVDAQTAMTVAEQRYFDTVFELRSAIARLEYAIGIN